MRLRFKNRNTETGDADFEVSLSQEELTFLVNFAIESLIGIGAIAVNQAENAEQDIVLPLEPQSGECFISDFVAPEVGEVVAENVSEGEDIEIPTEKVN